ncbi:serine palmitoyltransferase small subunit A [Drosophila takahashii]|uniref:serine palmitoyltransferase small subunit A n=1 Tax=Drosophila takahashii TaxID=29030 RepID=UPI001CF88766|nr:serine palmitoyltransferase small subunit B [Drosophila takahashii]
MLNLKHLASHAYRQYELVTCINMLEPWERKLINGFFLFMLALVIFSSFMYLPDYLHTLLQFVTPATWHSSPENAAYVAQKMARS